MSTKELIINVSFGLGVTVTFFVIVEIVFWLCGVRPLRDYSDPFVGYAASSPLFVSEGDDMVTAPNKLTVFNLQRFPAKKGKDTFRIFSLGGSTTYGHPY